MHEVYNDCLQEGVALVEEVSRGQAKHGGPTALLQQETPGRKPNTLLVCPVQHWVPVDALLLASVLCYATLCCVYCGMLCRAMLLLCHAEL